MGLIVGTSPLLHRLEYSSMSVDQRSVIDALIEVASELIEKYCNRQFARDDYTEVISGSGTEMDYVLLRNIPINSVASVSYVDPIDGEVTTVTNTANDNFHFNPETGELWWQSFSESTSKFKDTFPELHRNITVIYNGGYAEIPMPIQMVCAQMVETMYDPSSQAAGTLEKEKLGEYFYQLNVDKVSKQLTDQNKILSLYRRRW